MEKCIEFEKLLSDYIDGDLDGKKRAEMEAHLADCAPCAECLDSFRSIVDGMKRMRSRELSSDLRRRLHLEVPPECKARLHRYLAENLSRRR